MASDSVTGSCFCGTIRFTVRPPTRFCGHCHCSMCRRNHGAAYVTWFVVPYEQFTLDAGEGDLVRFKSSDHGTRSFCGRCGSSLFCESTHHPDVIDIVLANMHGPLDRRPESHFYFSDRVDWVPLEDDLPRLGGTTGMEPLPPK